MRLALEFGELCGWMALECAPEAVLNGGFCAQGSEEPADCAAESPVKRLRGQAL